MAIIKIRDENGKVQEIPVIKGDKGDAYVLTEADKQEIANLINASQGGVDLSNYYIKSETDALVKGSIKIWQPNTEYKVGDVCLTNVISYGGNTTETVILTCLEDHVSQDDGGALGDIAAKKWERRILHAGTSIYDGLYNVIHETYATKDELKNYLTEEQVLALIQANMLTETWKFELEDGTIVTKDVMVL